MLQPTYTSYTLICLFSAAIVALGAQELHRQYVARQDASRGPNVELVQALRGGLTLDAGSLSPEDIEQLKKHRAPSGSEKKSTGWFSDLWSSGEK